MKTFMIRKLWLPLFLMALLFSMLPITVYAGEIPGEKDDHDNTYYEIPRGTDTIADFTKLTFSHNADNFNLKNATLKQINGNGEFLVLVDKPADASNGWNVSDIGTITFREIGKIGDAPIDVIVTLNSATFGPCAEADDTTTESDQVQVAMLSKNGELWIGGYDIEDPDLNNNSKTCWHGTLNVNVTTSVVWSDTQKTVELPFIHVASDIDVHRSDFRESFETISGYTGNYYGYADHTWDMSSTGKGNMLFQASTTAPETSGSESYTKGGVYAETTDGTFTSQFLSNACAAALTVHSQYIVSNQNTNPDKSVDNADDGSYDVNDTITYNVRQKMGHLYVDTFNSYESMSIYDILPDGLTYRSAQLLDESGNEVENTVGNINYNNETKKVSFDFTPNWLEDLSHYNGQTYTLKIDATIDHSAAGQIIKNTGYTSIGGLTFTSNEVEIKVTPDPIKVPINATKILTGTKLTDNQFTFKLVDETGESVAEAKNDASGNISFLVELTEGTYSYTLSEVNDKQKNITYDNTTYNITVQVTERENGILTVNVTNTSSKGETLDNITFHNTYTAPEVTDKPASPKTGDSANIGLGIVLTLCTLIYIMMNVLRKKYDFR